jgi:hypothetical protein
MRKIVAFAVFSAIQIALLAQTAPPRPKFDVVSIKPDETPERHRGMFRTPQGLYCIDYTLKDLIHLGWDVRDFQIRGGPSFRLSTELKKHGSGRAHEKENPRAFMRYGLRVQPAPLVRGSSRRIMTLRFRPAHIRVINRRYLLPAATCSAFITKMAALSPDGEARPAKQIKDHQPRRLSRA